MKRGAGSATIPDRDKGSDRYRLGFAPGLLGPNLGDGKTQASLLGEIPSFEDREVRFPANNRSLGNSAYWWTFISDIARY